MKEWTKYSIFASGDAMRLALFVHIVGDAREHARVAVGVGLCTIGSGHDSNSKSDNQTNK